MLENRSRIRWILGDEEKHGVRRVIGEIIIVLMRRFLKLQGFRPNFYTVIFCLTCSSHQGRNLSNIQFVLLTQFSYFQTSSSSASAMGFRLKPSTRYSQPESLRKPTEILFTTTPKEPKARQSSFVLEPDSYKTNPRNTQVHLRIQIKRRAARERIQLGILKRSDHTYSKLTSDTSTDQGSGKELPSTAAYMPNPHIASDARK